MDRSGLIEELRVLIGDYLKSEGLELVDLIHRYEGRDLVLRVLADKPQGGITVDECAYLNEQLGRILDEKDILKASYMLEVSSPGLDRPLRTKNDFSRCLSRKVRFFFNEPVRNKLELEAVIEAVGEDAITVSLNGEMLEIPLLKINKGKQVIE
ncbi:MAG: ribosome maturation factor RimP [Candidatus Omnitrophota bacterium]